MNKLAFAVAFSSSLCAFAFAFALVGCAAPTEESSDESASQSEEELKSAECPKAVDVVLMKPSIMSDAKLLSAWEKDFDYESDPAATAQEQMTRLTSHVARARSQNAVKLHGTVRQACFYETVDAQTGADNGYRLWFAKSGGRNGQLQLRIERDLGGDDALFFKVPMKTISRTDAEIDSSKVGSAYAQIHETGYHGEPDGPNAWIGGVKATVTVSQ